MSGGDGGRLFLALWPEASVRAALAAGRDAWAWAPGVTRQADARLHLTLHFLGAVDPVSMPRLLEALPRFGPRFELQIGRAVLWPSGIAALEPEAPGPALAALHQALAVASAGAGFATDPRPFRPHVTLARRAQRSVPPLRPAATVWPVSGYALVRSEAGTGTYEVLQTVD